MPVSSEWKSAWQAALDEMAAAKEAHTHFERAVVESKQGLSNARREARDIERDARDESKRLIADIRERARAEEADARQMVADAKEAAKDLLQSATDQLEDAQRNAGPTAQRIVDATAAYTKINYSKPQFTGSWDAAKAAGAFENARLAAPTGRSALRGRRGYRGASEEQQLRRNAELHQQREASGAAARDHEADLEWLRSTSANSEDSSLTDDLDAELAALQRSMDQESDEHTS